MNVRKNGPQRHLTDAEKRWTLEQRQRLESTLRRVYVRAGSYVACAEAIGASETAVKRVLSQGCNITVDLAEKLAAHLWTTADEIAFGKWTPKGRAA
jgi:predicted aldo/keto reductase-like oxidoreductase